VAGEDLHNPGHLDARPLVREYFGDQLRSALKQPMRNTAAKKRAGREEDSDCLVDNFLHRPSSY